MVSSIGADRVIDYTREDFTRNEQRYDMIIDAVGNRSVADYKRALSPGGVCAIIGFSSLGLLLSEVAEAIRYLEKEHARGKIVIMVERSDKN